MCSVTMQTISRLGWWTIAVSIRQWLTLFVSNDCLKAVLAIEWMGVIKTKNLLLSPHSSVLYLVVSSRPMHT